MAGEHKGALGLKFLQKAGMGLAEGSLGPFKQTFYANMLVIKQLVKQVGGFVVEPSR